MDRHRRGVVGFLTVVCCITLIAAGCGSSKSSSNSGSTATTTASGVAVPSGGTLTIGAEQEPDCTDWIDSCGGSSWGFWMANVTTMPHAFDTTWDGKVATYKPSILLTGEPTLVTSPKQVVTYHINPKAVWSDGQPITSADFKYTFDQIAGPTATDIYDPTGYNLIESVDDSDPATAVVTYSTPYAGWKSLFGGGYGIMPSHILTGQDRDTAMKDGYSWSGGPWTFTWQKGVSMTLVPNPKYWGPKPKLDKVVFKFVTDTAAEFAAMKDGEVSVTYPQPQIDVVTQIKAGLTGIKSVVNPNTGSIEALWLNNAKAPLDDEKVRQAIAYSLDRDAIVNKLFGGIGVTKASQSLEPYIVGQFTDLQAFAKYKLDLKKVDSLMTGDGWAKGSDGIWAKGGTPANITIQSTTGNERRELTEQILQQQLKTAGFTLTIDNQKAGDLFGTILPAGTYQMGLYAQVVTAPEPGACTLFCDKNNPDKHNGTGQNWQRVFVGAAADKDLQGVDTLLDPAKRATAGKAGMDALAATAASIPLDPLPDILLWSDKVVGPINENPVMGPFWNMNLWGLKS